MNLSITGRHLDITPAIRQYVTEKLARVARHFDNVIDTQVILSIEPLKHTADITMRLRGKDIHCEAADENLYAAIDLLADKIDRQVLKYKSKIQDHAHEPVKRQEVPAIE
ncbi:ribosome-associated translation inhibitor RaiA [Candidimonas sp. SYP-B2681]|uniref:ribosome hibernation-promoting factor, HPF/YfiA family n=1 Tax=Candidimonas sp. SYP-B2681 TaxID=2497686 RepID=UPI000F866760|nr:ribosome-associated translation inhibitor RaiA [Candidimonas sp. SYP-B2681]RTZ43122.1 ribosome-associated translation inhibitor RaiA [Candidimonas sp. SYP-B2681]